VKINIQIEIDLRESADNSTQKHEQSEPSERLLKAVASFKEIAQGIKIINQDKPHD
jgi:hypothetical protein